MAEQNTNPLAQNFDILVRMQNLRLEIARLEHLEGYEQEALTRTSRYLSVAIAEVAAMRNLGNNDVHHKELEILQWQQEVDRLQRRVDTFKMEREQMQMELQQLNRTVHELNQNL